MKLIVTDYDDTLYINDDDLNENIKYLKEWQKLGNIIMISTGRSYPSIKNQIDIYHIPYDYLSCADGSILYDNNGNILKMFKLNKVIIKPFQRFYQDLNYEEIQFSYPRGYSNILLNNNDLLGINICLSTDNYNDTIVNNFINMSKHYPKYNFLNYRHPHFSYLCIKPKNIDKSSTIDYLKELLSISNNDIYVIGDSSNDYEMIKKYNGVAMKNSCQQILDITKIKYNSVSDYLKKIIN